MEKQSFSEKHPVLASAAAAFIFLFVVFTAGAASAITGISSKVSFILAFGILALGLALWISMKKRWSYYGFTSVSKLERKEKILFVPLFVMALLPLIVGFSSELKLQDILYICAYMAMVAFAEEAMFRGVILRILQKKSNRYAIWGSCILFSIPHLMNTLAGKELWQAVLQVVFAFIIGSISAMLVIKTNHILLLIAYHFLNNTVSSITNTEISAAFAQYFTLAILIIGFIYMIYLLRLMKSGITSAKKEEATYV